MSLCSLVAAFSKAIVYTNVSVCVLCLPAVFLCCVRNVYKRWSQKFYGKIGCNSGAFLQEKLVYNHYHNRMCL